MTRTLLGTLFLCALAIPANAGCDLNPLPRAKPVHIPAALPPENRDGPLVYIRNGQDTYGPIVNRHLKGSSLAPALTTPILKLQDRVPENWK